MSDHDHVWIKDRDHIVCTHCEREVETLKRTITIEVVPEEACPTCGAHSGHSDPSLDFFNRPKVAMEDGVWWWKCYNPTCSTGYYNPETGEVEKT